MIGVIKGDTRSIDYSSFQDPLPPQLLNSSDDLMFRILMVLCMAMLPP